jgi:hypothetical protein
MDVSVRIGHVTVSGKIGGGTRRRTRNLLNTNHSRKRTTTQNAEKISSIVAWNQDTGRTIRVRFSTRQPVGTVLDKTTGVICGRHYYSGDPGQELSEFHIKADAARPPYS